MGDATFHSTHWSIVRGGAESLVPLAPMLVFGVVSVLFHRAGRLHLATVAMGAAGALAHALRSRRSSVCL
jgi:hypothetical protein